MKMLENFHNRLKKRKKDGLSGDSLSKVRRGCQGRQRAGVWGQGKGVGGGSITLQQGLTSCSHFHNDKTCLDTSGPYTPKAVGSTHYEHSVLATSMPGTILLSSLLLVSHQGAVNLHLSWVLSIPFYGEAQREEIYLWGHGRKKQNWNKSWTL